MIEFSQPLATAFRDAVISQASFITVVLTIAFGIFTAFLLPTLSAYFAWRTKQEEREEREAQRKHADFVKARQDFIDRHLQALQGIIDGATEILKVAPVTTPLATYTEHLGKYRGVAFLYPKVSQALKAFENTGSSEDFDNLVEACEETIQMHLFLQPNDS